MTTRSFGSIALHYWYNTVVVAGAGGHPIRGYVIVIKDAKGLPVD